MARWAGFSLATLFVLGCAGDARSPRAAPARPHDRAPTVQTADPSASPASPSPSAAPVPPPPARRLDSDAVDCTALVDPSVAIETLQPAPARVKGRWLAFATGTSVHASYAAPLPRKAITLVTDATLVETQVAGWSPDGRWLAVLTRHKDQFPKLLVFPVSGGQIGRPRALASRMYPEGWSGDGQYLALSVDDALAVYSPQRGTELRFAISGRNYAWNPKREALAYLGPGNDAPLYMVSLPSGAERPLRERASDFAWSPDGKKIAVHVEQPPSRPECRALLVVLDVDKPRSEERTLACAPMYWRSYWWSPDSRWLAFHVQGEDGGLRVADLAATNEPISIANPGQRAYWSPNGEWLGFFGPAGSFRARPPSFEPAERVGRWQYRPIWSASADTLLLQGPSLLALAFEADATLYRIAARGHDARALFAASGGLVAYTKNEGLVDVLAVRDIGKRPPGPEIMLAKGVQKIMSSGALAGGYHPGVAFSWAGDSPRLAWLQRIDGGQLMLGAALVARPFASTSIAALAGEILGIPRWQPAVR